MNARRNEMEVKGKHEEAITGRYLNSDSLVVAHYLRKKKAGKDS